MFFMIIWKTCLSRITREPRRTQIVVEPKQAYDPNPRRAHYKPNPRRPNPELVDQDERTMRNTRLEAPTFDGCRDPKVYLDWKKGMDQYFEWNDMSE